MSMTGALWGCRATGRATKLGDVDKMISDPRTTQSCSSLRLSVFLQILLRSLCLAIFLPASALHFGRSHNIDGVGLCVENPQLKL